MHIRPEATMNYGEALSKSSTLKPPCAIPDHARFNNEHDFERRAVKHPVIDSPA
jgi:hypothetical protein